jgi:hypothetical protein
MQQFLFAVYPQNMRSEIGSRGRGDSGEQTSQRRQHGAVKAIAANF